MALHSATVIARASGSEAELCLYTVNDDDDTISNDAALHCYFLKIWFENGDLALNCGFQPPTELSLLAKHRYLDSILPLIDRAR